MSCSKERMIDGVEEEHSVLQARLVQVANTNDGRKRGTCIALFVSVLLGLVSGTLYGFGRYAKDLKSLLDIDQLQVQRLGVLLDCGGYIGHPAAGWLYDRAGPRTSCSVAATIVFCAYLCIHLGVSLRDPVLFRSPGIMGASFFAVGFGGGLGYMAALGSTTKNFEATPHLSKAVGIVAAGFGLSSSVVALSYAAVGLSHFFLLWAFLVAATNILGACFLREILPNAEEDSAAEPRRDSVETYRAPQPAWKPLRMPSFWMLFVSFMCCTGCGLFVINNISTMVQSAGGTDALAGNLVILFSLCNCLGRLATGYVADKQLMSKLSLFNCDFALMAFALFLSAALYGPRNANMLVITVILTAFSYGGSWVLIVGILNDSFGSINFGKNYGVIAMGPALSGMVINIASARMYQQHIAAPDVVECVGAGCYSGAFLLTGAAAILGFFIILLLMRDRRSESSRYQSPLLSLDSNHDEEEVSLSSNTTPPVGPENDESYFLLPNSIIP